MKTFILSIVLLFASVVSGQDPVIQGIIDAVDIEAMIQSVEEMSGEVSVDLGSGPVLITSRHRDNAGNALAQQYYEQRFVDMGYTTEEQPFTATGRNILVTKEGLLYPDEIVILCAHYDAMPAGMFAAPAADDDGSGCATVLEAARILRDIPFAYTIVFALWDEEEQGKVGSNHYAQAMAADDEVIRGVVNMDAIAYDGNGDTKARVHVRPVANSMAIGDTVFAVLDRYNIDIDLLLTNPGAIYSDHASFWTAGYGAVLIIEEFGADGNPQYHTPNDRVEYFDVPYFEKLAKLSIGTFATLAVPFDPTASIHSTSGMANALYLYPNPTSDQAVMWVELESDSQVAVHLLNALGQELDLLYQGPLTQGKRAFNIPLATYPPGTYSVVLTYSDGRQQVARVVRTP